MDLKINNLIKQIDVYFSEYIHQLNIPVKLKDAMAYSFLSNGKRFRPFLLFTILETIGYESEDYLSVAVALEMIHTYSLIHDDLPCMDDDDLRRGVPTLHKKFDEATAVLAGDALLTEAFNVICKTECESDTIVKLVSLLSSCSGASGMIAGQILDIDGEEKELSYDELKRVHVLKTGELISFTAKAASVIANLSDTQTQNLISFANNLGLAFQIKDDLLEVESSTEILGKSANSDIEKNKSTYVTILGINKARNFLDETIVAAKDSLNKLPFETEHLNSICDLVTDRKK